MTYKIAKAAVIAVSLAVAGCAHTDVGTSPVAIGPSASPLNATTESDLYLSVIEGLIEQESYRAALAFLDQYAVQQNENPRYLLLRGEALLGTNRFADAIQAFSELDGTSYAADALNGKGRAEAGRGNWPTAVEHFESAARLAPSNAKFLNNRAYAKLQAGQYDLASAQFDLQQAHELDPQSPLIRNNLVLAHVMADDVSGADAVLSGIDEATERDAVSRFAQSWSQEHHFTSSSTDGEP